jgi:hypothetical protein
MHETLQRRRLSVMFTSETRKVVVLDSLQFPGPTSRYQPGKPPAINDVKRESSRSWGKSDWFHVPPPGRTQVSALCGRVGNL